MSDQQVMSARERVRRAVRFQRPDRVPRDCWVLPWAHDRYPEETRSMQEAYPLDVTFARLHPERLPHMKGQEYERGEYVDEWGCRFVNLTTGAVGEVKEPLVATWNDLDKVKPPYEWLEGAFGRVDEQCAATDLFVITPPLILFERMQFIRGTEQLLIDLMEQPSELFKLRDRVHEFNRFALEKCLQTDVDGIAVNDDWGAQRALLIPPGLWREVFKSCYAEYVTRCHDAGKLFFMHSDGHIMEIFEDFIEIGVDAINSQLFCMDIEEIGRRFKGRIAFWGEIDRQHVLPSPETSDVDRAVVRVAKALYDPSGGIIAQCDFSLGARPENVREVYAAWERWERGS